MKHFYFSGVLSLLLIMVSTSAHAAVNITESGGWLESAYVQFTLDSSYDGYNVYYSTNQSSWTKIDAALVRKYKTYGRADVVGISAGNYYVKVVPTNNGTEQTSVAVTTSALTVQAHDRSGFAFTGSQMPGAYQSNGTLKSNAIVVYVTESNKNSVEASINYTSKGVAQTATGILAILTAYKKGYETRPLCIRFIGNVTDNNFNFLDFTNSSAATSIDAASDFKGDIMVTSNKKDLGGVTIEGIGNDAVANGWGIRFKGLNYGEVRNLGFMNCNSDEGDDVGLQQDNNYCWVHHCDMFYGNAGSDKDQVKGDGALDCKKSNYITFSYNHFWDCGKCNLLGLSEGTVSYASSPYYITYHHNWYDHSDSRHPRVRYYNAHVYNNYYDGNSKYGAGSTLGSSVFMEGNYFRNCKYPMMTSMQGSDVYAGTTTRETKNNPTFSSEDGGTIKAYNNYMTGSYTFIPYGETTYTLNGSSTPVGSINTTQDFDAYVVTSRNTTVPSSVTSYKGTNYYSNFDTSLPYSYTAQEPAAAMSTITGTYGAGRMQHGDFSWTFSSSDDTSYDVNNSLKSALTNYTNSDYVGLFSDDTSSSGGNEEEEQPSTESDDATLSSLTVSGYSLAFSSSTTYYNVTLAYDAETAPTVSAVANNANATVSIKQATSTTGSATVTVTAEDGTTKKIYTIQFSLGSEPAPSGSSISSAMTFNIGDGTNTYKSYITGTFNTSTSGSATYGGVTNSSLCIKMESSTSLTFTITKAFTMTFVAGSTETASFYLDGTKVAASSGNTVSVNVAAGTHTMTKSGAIKMYFLDFAEVETEVDPEPTQSSDASLSALSVAGYTLSPTFASSTLTYSVELAAGTTTVPEITATCNESHATYSVDIESCHPAGQAIIDVEAEDGTLGKYYINFTVAPAYYNVSASAGTGGSASVSPSGSVEEGTQVTFTATPNSGYTFSKWSDNSTDNPHVVTVTGDLTLTAAFTADATPAPSGDVVLLEVNGAKVAAGGTFTGSTCTTSVKFESDTEVTDQSDKSSYSTSTGNVYRSADATSFTIALNSTSASQIVVAGTSTSGSSARTITGISVDGNALDAEDYSVEGSFVNKSTVHRVTISGLNISQNSTITITTSGNVHYYYCEVTPLGSTPSQASTDATLSDLKVDGVTVSGFNASTLTYNISLPYGTTTVPTVTYTLNDNTASSVLNNANAVPGSTSVVVTAGDGTTTKTYTVNFAIQTSLTLTDGVDYTLAEGVTYADGVTYTRNFSNSLVNKWSSFYVPFAINVEDYLEQFDIAEIFALCPVKDTNNDGDITAEDENYLILSKKASGSTIPNMPYMIRVKSAGEQAIEAVDGTLYASASGTVSCYTTATTYTFIGTYSTIVANADNDYWYMGGGKISHMTTSGSTNINTYRWYMSTSNRNEYSSSTNTQNSFDILVIGEDIDNTTAVNVIRQKSNQNDEIMYNLNGQMVNSSAAKGIYIKNGVKVIR